MRIAPELIDADADKVVRRLARHGFQAYLVGGCVRDLLLDRAPKDFDVSTSATPKEIKQLFRNCRIIGRRFRLAHVFFGAKIIETSTFRANPRESEGYESDELLIRRDNVFGSEAEDARRRDFTINGLFYDVEAEKVIDHVGGLADLERRVIRTIGDPDIRFREDPVRMLRAIKFAARLGFDIEDGTLAALVRHRRELAKSAQPRLLEELYRLLRSGAAHRSMTLLMETGLAAVLSPHLADLLGVPPDPILGEGLASAAAETEPAAVATSSAVSPPRADELAWRAVWSDQPEASTQAPLDEDEWNPIDEEAEADAEADDDDEGSLEEDLDLDSTDEIEIVTGSTERPAVGGRPELVWAMFEQFDQQFASRRELSNSMLLAAVCTPSVFDILLESGIRPLEANEAILEVLQPLTSELGVARRDAERTRQILLAQRRLSPSRRRRGKPMSLVRRDFFGDALMVYEMIGTAGGYDTSDLGYWSKLHAQEIPGDREGEVSSKRRRRRRGGRRRRRPHSEPTGEREPALGG